MSMSTLKNTDIALVDELLKLKEKVSSDVESINKAISVLCDKIKQVQTVKSACESPVIINELESDSTLQEEASTIEHSTKSTKSAEGVEDVAGVVSNKQRDTLLVSDESVGCNIDCCVPSTVTLLFEVSSKDSFNEFVIKEIVLCFEAFIRMMFKVISKLFAALPILILAFKLLIFTTPLIKHLFVKSSSCPASVPASVLASVPA